MICVQVRDSAFGQWLDVYVTAFRPPTAPLGGLLGELPPAAEPSGAAAGVAAAAGAACSAAAEPAVPAVRATCTLWSGLLGWSWFPQAAAGCHARRNGGG